MGEPRRGCHAPLGAPPRRTPSRSSFHHSLEKVCPCQAPSFSAALRCPGLLQPPQQQLASSGITRFPPLPPASPRRSPQRYALTPYHMHRTGSESHFKLFSCW